jgi:hypothetical protein
MKKRPLQESEMSACVTAASISKFNGTDNPRHLRVIHAALRRSLPREHVDHEAGCSNGPELVAELRRRGLEFPCVRIEALDRDGKPCKPGVYNLTSKDRSKINRWLAARQKGGIDLMLTGWLAFAGVCALMLSGAM